ncbi:MAG: hypothetical protein P4L84_37745 [Isosphaeraceae bacterium]|nr:hypothetical protein [Isosphaeraceae bacterium]
MSDLARVGSEDALRQQGVSRGLVGWVCTQNPFYVISALLVCLGLWVSFGSQVVASQTWALLLGMTAYTLLLAVTACLLVRCVGVWDDVRTVLLLVVLMFLATSVTFDEVLARNPSRGMACYVAGLLFAVSVSEWMLRGMRLKLPPLFRAPYYLTLGLFYLYPVAITPLLERPRSETLYWALFGFTPAAGLVALSLLPAVRRGRQYVEENGSPWPWAWYPWTLFGLLALAVPARSALLCWSMHHVARAESEPYIFGWYFLAPFLLAVGVVLLELGLVERKPSTVRFALCLPAVATALALLGHRPEEFYQEFLAHFNARLGGTPLYLSLFVSALFYTYAALRRGGAATDALTATLVFLSVVAPGTLDLKGVVSPRPLPVLAVAALQLGLGLRRRDAWRCLLGAVCLVGAACLVMPAGGASSQRGPVAFHLVLLATLSVGAAFDDALGRLLRGAGSALGVGAGLAVITGWAGRDAGLPGWVVTLYPLSVAALIAGYGLLLDHRTSLAFAALVVAVWLLAGVWHGYAILRRVVVGLDFIAIGMVVFSLAVLTSLAKGGVLPWRLTPAKGKMTHSSE